MLLGKACQVRSCEVTRVRVTTQAMLHGSELLKRHLDKRNERPAELSRRGGIPESAISRYLRGITTPGLAHAFTLEDLTGGKVPARSWVAKTK